MNLIQDAEDKIRVLKHASAWDPGNSQETPAMALTATPTLTKQLREYLANQIMMEIKHLLQHGKAGKDGKFCGKFSAQDCLFVTLQNMLETKKVQNHAYHWCTKCNCGSGQWVIIHTNSTHKDDYVHPYKRQDDNKRQGILKSANNVRFQDQKVMGSQQDRDNTPSAQLSFVIV